MISLAFVFSMKSGVEEPDGSTTARAIGACSATNLVTVGKSTTCDAKLPNTFVLRMSSEANTPLSISENMHAMHKIKVTSFESAISACSLHALTFIAVNLTLNQEIFIYFL